MWNSGRRKAAGFQHQNYIFLSILAAAILGVKTEDCFVKKKTVRCAPVLNEA